MKILGNHIQIDLINMLYHNDKTFIDKKIIIIKIGDLFFWVINFAHKKAHPQKKASMQGKIMTDSGIRNIL